MPMETCQEEAKAAAAKLEVPSLLHALELYDSTVLVTHTDITRYVRMYVCMYVMHVCT